MTISTGQLLAIHPSYAQQARTEARPQKSRRPFRGEVALVELYGVLWKPTLVEARMKINQLANDPNVGEILLLVHSPGGSVAGTHDLYESIHRAAKLKPVRAFIEDMGASGAYYAVSGATEIIMNETGECGSIGVYIVLADASRAFEERGVDVLVIRSGQHKGTGQYGAKITTEEIQQIQHVVDTQARIFTAAVAKGRNMEVKRVRDLADGRIFLGREAVGVGLVDRIAMFEDVVEDILSRKRDRYEHLDGPDALKEFQQRAIDEHRRFKKAISEAERSVEREFPVLAKSALREKELRDSLDRHKSHAGRVSYGTAGKRTKYGILADHL